ncbi:MAG TPA: DUF5777 family beta-barrel protein [Thermoanaerobaculia bacterium]|jgi:hypothetical protein
MIRRLLVMAALGMAALPAALHAQDYTPTAPLPLGDTLLSLPSSQIPSVGTWEVKFTHRFNESVDDGGFHSLFGLDSSADVTFGASFSIRRDLQVTILRSNTNDTIETAAKFVVLRQAPSMPISIALRGGLDLRTEENLGDRTSVFAQAILSRQFGRRAEISILPTYVTNAGRAVAGDESVALFDGAFNVPIGIAIMIRPPLAIVAELIPPNQDLPDNMKADLGWAIGLKRNVGGHWFEILLTNSNSTLTDQPLTSTFQGTPLDANELHLGFNIERRFGRRRR